MGWGIKCTRMIFKTKMFYCSRTSLYVKLLFGKRTHPLDSETRKMLVMGCSFVNENRPFSYSAKESGSSAISYVFYTGGSIEWR